MTAAISQRSGILTDSTCSDEDIHCNVLSIQKTILHFVSQLFVDNQLHKSPVMLGVERLRDLDTDIS